MDLITKRLGDLTDSEVAVWRASQTGNPLLRSPHFCFEMAKIAEETRGDVFVSVIAEQGAPVGFLPFHRCGSIATAPAGPLASFQGGIFPLRLEVDMEEVVRAAGLKAYKFDHLLDEQHGFERWKMSSAKSHLIDLANGFKAYHQERMTRHPKRFKELARTERKLHREHEVRFEVDCRDSPVLRMMLNQKSKQLDEMGVWNFLHESWTVSFLERVFEHHARDFAGLLSVLWVDDEPGAIAFSYRSGHVLHGNVLTYNSRSRKYSPGLQLVMALARACDDMEVTRFDLGRGEEAYKELFANTYTSVAEGAVDLRPLARRVTQGWYAGKNYVRRTSVAAPARRMVRRLRAMSGR